MLMVGFLAAAAVISVATLLMSGERTSKAVEVTQRSLERINQALVAYVALNGRLPCPAGVADGKAAPETATNTCTSGAGIVPWRTLGLTEDIALDGWNRLISYRVLDGATGLTQTDGASMVNCDTKLPYGAEVLPANGLCRTDHKNLDTQYLKSKGLVVSDNSTLINGVAFVLISHGESGSGAYQPSGIQTPLPTSAHELANTAAGGTYYRDIHSAPGTDPGNNQHFDDILTWMTISDVVRKSGLSARDWSPTEVPAITAASMQNMNTTGQGHFNVASGSNGSFSATTTSSSSGTTATLAFGAGASSVYSSCSWWPTPFLLYNSADRFTLSLYLEFAISSTSRGNTDFGGFLIGFLPSISSAGVTTVINNNLCGEDGRSRNLGWAYDPSVSEDPGNLPSPRFGVELDSYSGSGVNDPDYNHLAVDFDGTTHNNILASNCSSFPDSYHTNNGTADCYTSGSDAWLRNGLQKFHRMRIEVTPRDTTCPSSYSSRLKAWVIPETVCPDGSADAFCTAAKTVSTAFSPSLPLTAGVIALDRCIAAPAINLFDQLYFGIMATNRSGTSAAVYFRNLDATAYLTP